MDVDRSAWPSLPATDPLELEALDSGARWLTANYRAGDVVVFTMKTLHAGTRNETRSQLRLSADLRFQPAAHERDERWMGFPPTMHQREQEVARSQAEARVEWGLAKL